MQSNPHFLPRTNLQDQIAVMHVERLVFWESLCSATRHVGRKWIALLDNRRKQKWIWVILLALASYESYFVRAACGTLLPHHSLCGFGCPARTVHSHGPRLLLWNSLDCVGRRLIPFFAATPSCITCPSTGPARGSTECSGRQIQRIVQLDQGGSDGRHLAGVSRSEFRRHKSPP